jgi:hypothetical protein
MEIDDASLHGFARGLAAHANGFRASDATRWASGDATYDWPRIRELLEALVAERVLQRLP